MLIDGVSAERVLYPGRVPPGRQVDLLDRVLDGLRPPAEQRASAREEEWEEPKGPAAAARKPIPDFAE